MTIHAEKERSVARKFGVSVVPSVVLVLETQPHHYRDTVISGSKVIGK
jgi:thioredoxin-like negative regulator of GroEL